MYESLPPFPGVIKGHFDPVQWASDPNRRSYIYDAENPPPSIPASDTITGNPGSGGIVKGIVRRIDSPEEGHLLQQGEILVTATTNVGWTPLFPRAAAVITDIGMPLAHAAIVARELGIPAVVGCGAATTRLRNGDLVLVDGGRGTVQILDSVNNSKS
jgi:pyruvate,water dikinase